MVEASSGAAAGIRQHTATILESQSIDVSVCGDADGA